MRARAIPAAAALCLTLAPDAGGQDRPALSNMDRDRGRTMLRVVRKEVEKNYYDSTFHGLDLDAHFGAAEQALGRATSNGEVFAVIAKTLLDFNDSHLLFLPPEFAGRVEYGWDMGVVGDSVYVTDVTAGSDAEAQGLARGDLVLAVNGRPASRGSLWLIQYIFGALRPQPGLRVDVQRPGGERRSLDLAAKVSQGRRVIDLTNPGGDDVRDLIIRWENSAPRRMHRYVTVGDSVLLWKIPGFSGDRAPFDEMLKQAARHRALVLDLRGNGGGAELTLLHVLGGLFEQDVQVGVIRRRKESKPLVAKGTGAKAFRGPLVVLVDAQSASASELLARTVQLAHRGTVVGDLSAGMVMRSRVHGLQLGVDRAIFYGANITDADIVMPDGGRLEGRGVLPDERVLPSGADLAAGRDPALALALELVGVHTTPESAGRVFRAADRP